MKMLFVRTLSRAVPRTVSRFSATTVCRPLSTVRQSSVVQPSWRRVSKPIFTAGFSTSRIRREKEGQVDEELIAKFDSELQMEKEMRDSDELPTSVKDFLDSGSFELQDTPGQEEVVLTRHFGDETIRITFSIADLNTLDQDPDRLEGEDRALYDEDDGEMPEGQSGGGNTKGSINQGRTKGGNINVQQTSEDSVAPADRPELADDESATGEGEEEQEPSFPARVNVTVEKAGKGAMQIETIAQDGMIVIENVYYFPNAEMADAKNAETDWQKRGMYTGPPFGNLDEDLQLLLERYLDERGINTALALFVPDYIDFKEQREYLTWLSNVKSFVAA